MALVKVTYVNGETIIGADNLNAIQDNVILNAANIATNTGNIADSAADISALQSGKVDKVSGKGLSTNDFTNADKTKLDGIEAQATRVLIDNTLAQSGEAADAKAAGDAIGEVKDSLVTPTETGTTASQAYAPGDYFWRSGALYRATSKINEGDSFTSANSVEVPVANDLRRIAIEKDSQINALHNLVNYGYDNPVDRNSPSHFVGRVVRNGTRILLDGECPVNSTTVKLVASNPKLTTFVSSASDTAADYPMQLIDGHTYRARLHTISGTTTQNVYPIFHSSTGVAALGEGYTDPLTGDKVRDFTYNSANYPVGVSLSISIYRRYGSNVLNNFLFDLTVEDITNGAAGQEFLNIAPAELETATATHAVGDLLIYKYQLYEVTAAIAAGETLVPGTNITPTTIAAQLAALKSLINS